MIRTILVLLFLLCFFIISIPLYLIEAIIGHFDIHKKERSSFVIVTTALKIIIWLSGIHLIVKGQEKVPKDQAVLYVSNHRSYFDIVTLYPLTNNTTGFVAKKELERIPFIRRWMRYMNCQFLDRENIKEGLKTILNCIATVKGGCSVCIFPEGTRNTGEELSVLPFHSGSFKIAEKSGCPIVPISMNNTISIFEKQFPRIKKTHVIIEYGKPIYVKDLDREQKKQLSQNCQKIIEDTIKKNQALL